MTSTQIPLLNLYHDEPKVIVDPFEEFVWSNRAYLKLGKGPAFDAYNLLRKRYDRGEVDGLGNALYEERTPGDPRNLQGTEDCVVAFYDGQIGIHTEIELDFASASTPQHPGCTVYLEQSEYDKSVLQWQEALSPLCVRFPHTQFFLTHGSQTRLGQLSLNAFTGLLNGRLPSGQAFAPEEAAIMVSPYLFDQEQPDIRCCPTLKAIADELANLAFGRKA